ncbi:MAG: hypothetical protein P4L46_23435 [Fimbriimonas sp.]|nr:hypothetical protein [Fimbriimonas sp.]
MLIYLPLADLFSPETLAVMIPVVLACIPIVAILTKHQQKMAEIIHGSGKRHEAEVAQLRNEVYELKQMIHQQMIAMDTLSTSQRRPVEPGLQERLERTSNG